MFDSPFDRPFDHYDDFAVTTRDHDARITTSQFDERIEFEQPVPAEATQPQPAGTARRPLLIGLAVASVLATAWWGLGGQTPAPAAVRIPVVTAAVPIERQITEWDEFVGRFKATKTVEIRPQVSGQITSVRFTDGQYVRAGQALFTIDSRTFRASLAQARADVARASSALSLSQTNLARAQRLVVEDAVAATEIDRLRAEVRSNEASLAAARATAASRAIDVGFTVVRAPISGRISDRRVDAGNLVSGGGGAEASLLTTINAVDQVYFEFSGSEALYLKAQREGLAKGAPVEIRLADAPDYRWRGRLDFTDNGLDPSSGTIRSRAIVANPDGVLTPGLFGRMRLATGGTRAALLVPDAAVTTDQTRKQVLVVGKDGAVAARTVELGPQVTGLRVIEKGLKPTDRVVIKGVQMAMPGRIVAATPAAPIAPTDSGTISRSATATLAN